MVEGDPRSFASLDVVGQDLLERNVAARVVRIKMVPIILNVAQTLSSNSLLPPAVHHPAPPAPLLLPMMEGEVALAEVVEAVPRESQLKRAIVTKPPRKQKRPNP